MSKKHRKSRKGSRELKQAALPARAPAQPAPICYRVIVEMSCMNNNDEHFFCSPTPITREDVQKLARSDFDEPSLALCRPVFPQEIAAGLDVSKRGDNLYGPDELPALTRLLDAYFRLKNLVEFWQMINPKLTPSEILAEHIGTVYYDCMSGGMHKWDAVICGELVSHPSIDLDELVYPGKDRSALRRDEEPSKETWYTLRDWLEGREKDDSAELRTLFAQIAGELPRMFPALPAHEKK